MRMLALLTDAFGGDGGIAQYNRDFLSAFSNSSRHNSVVVLPLVPGKVVTDMAPEIKQNRPEPNRLRYMLRSLGILIKEGPFDVIFCGHLHIAPLAAFLSRAIRMPMWLQLHGIEAWKKPSVFRCRAAEQAALVTAVSRYTRRQFLGWAKISPHRVKVLPNTVGGRFAPGSKAAYLVDRYHLEGKTVLLSVGRLSSSERYKGHDKVISVLVNILEKEPDMVYIIAGDGNDRPRLEAMTREKGLEKAVRFVGRVKDHELPDLYRTADLFVMPSSGEGFGIVFLEAMACGVPVVGGVEGGVVDPLQDGMLGMAVPESKLVAAIENALVKSKESRDELSGAVENYFGKANFAKHINKLEQMCAAG